MTRDQWALGPRRCKGMHGTALSAAPGIFGERLELSLAAYSGTVVDGMLSILLDIGSNINIIGLKTVLAFARASRSHGHGINKLDLKKILCATGVGNGAAVCRASMLAKSPANARATLRGHPLSRG
eukprot:4072882-Pyramimonas_sp.AAC.1